MKNILIVFPHLIYPLDSGGAQAIFNGIDAIRHHYRVTVVYFEGRKDHHPQERQKLAQLLENVEIIPYFYSANKLHKLKEIERIAESKLLKNEREWKDLCWANFQMPMPGFMEFVNRIIREKSIDLVQLEMMESLPLALSLPNDVKRVFVHHELRFVRNEIRLNTMDSPNIYNRATVEMKRILEIGMLNRCDGVITLSETDKKKLELAGVRTPVYSSFAVVQQRKSIESNPTPYVLSFVGPEYHTPNYNGLVWFLDNCWPALKKNNQNYKLRIVGKWGKQTQKLFLDKYLDVKFLGFVDDLSTALSGTTMIVPIHEGSGIRMKILEAASMKVPVVTTSVGCEGLPVVDGQSCVLADTPDDFVKGVLSLDNDEFRDHIVQEANRVIRENYSIEALSANRMDIYRRIGI